MSANLTTEDLLRQATARLAGTVDMPRLEAELLLAHVLGVPRARLRSHPEDRPDDVARTRYASLIERRVSGEPLAYIVGEREFWSLPLAVSPAVLVPRPETELLVERALALHTAPTARVVDLGTGSGAIALALAHERPGWSITATDISQDALAVARANAERLGLQRIEFLHGSWFEPLAGRIFDLVLSNPPYVAADDPALLQPELGYEPSAALTPGPDALACLREIIAGAPEHLERGGWIVLEHGAQQAPLVARELVARGFTHVRSHRDLAGHERVTEAQWPAA
ncbi:MAG: peptide chain release factor N(5)-glutamine methyltransferase [Pseudomonadota bacterium]|jgi:protein-(glutamine-N5) methyltransferase, release factor-specific|nr:MAG: peptide chain release factor N(5)-glutamine methyltransferase [Pseudomonadota bacterium]